MLMCHGTRLLGKITIDVRLPGLNEVIASNRVGWKSGSTDKRQETMICSAYAKSAMNGHHIKPFETKVDVVVRWFEKDKRRDHDNIIGGGLKMAFDGFVKAGLLPDDSQRYVGRIYSEVLTDRNNPRVEFEFYEAE